MGNYLSSPHSGRHQDSRQISGVFSLVIGSHTNLHQNKSSCELVSYIYITLESRIYRLNPEI
jgi:hypothetical protein